MLLRALGLIGGAILGLAVIAFGFDFFRLFGINIQLNFSLPALLLMGAVAYVASHGKAEGVEAVPELIKVLAFVAALIFVVNFGNWIVALVFLGAYGAVYGKSFLAGWNYLFVQRPLEQEAVKQTLSAKLDADADLADATLRYERARAALAEAEHAAAEAERRRSVRP